MLDGADVVVDGDVVVVVVVVVVDVVVVDVVVEVDVVEVVVGGAGGATSGAPTNCRR